MTKTRRSEPAPQRVGLPEAVDAECVWFMATCIGTHGALRRFVPKQPTWHRLIGDDIKRALRTQRRLHPQEIQRVTEAFDIAHAASRAKILRLKPTPKRALLFERIVNGHGIPGLYLKYLSLADLQDAPTAGSA